MGPLIYQGLRKMLNELKDVQVTMESNELKAFTYNAIALLSKRIPSIVSSDFEFLASLFDQIKSEDQRVKVAIQEALNTMCVAYSQVIFN